ncbi:MAG TPA: hypothetical protein PKK79_05615, partial [Syntrophorhabdaceae bacterium]|nr:hypothetical protein [Syntrophorhabdaceae bacterium]
MALIEYVIYESSIGTLSLIAKGGRLVALEMTQEDEYRLARLMNVRYPQAARTEKPFNRVRLLLDRYLRGQKVDFDIPVDISAETPFTQKVLRVL